MRPFTTLTLTLSAVVLTACANTHNAPTTADGTYTQITFAGTKASTAERKRCESVGGTVRPAGKLQAEHCIQNLPDAGKNCSDASDCLGRCVLENDTGLTPGDPVTGVCEATDEVFGCTPLVRNGTFEGTLCID